MKFNAKSVEILVNHIRKSNAVGLTALREAYNENYALLGLEDGMPLTQNKIDFIMTFNTAIINGRKSDVVDALFSVFFSVYAPQVIAGGKRENLDKLHAGILNIMYLEAGIDDVCLQTSNPADLSHFNEHLGIIFYLCNRYIATSPVGVAVMNEVKKSLTQLSERARFWNNKKLPNTLASIFIQYPFVAPASAAPVVTNHASEDSYDPTVSFGKDGSNLIKAIQDGKPDLALSILNTFIHNANEKGGARGFDNPNDPVKLALDDCNFKGQSVFEMALEQASNRPTLREQYYKLAQVMFTNNAPPTIRTQAIYTHLENAMKTNNLAVVEMILSTPENVSKALKSAAGTSITHQDTLNYILQRKSAQISNETIAVALQIALNNNNDAMCTWLMQKYSNSKVIKRIEVSSDHAKKLLEKTVGFNNFDLTQDTLSQIQGDDKDDCAMSALTHALKEQKYQAAAALIGGENSNTYSLHELLCCAVTLKNFKAVFAIINDVNFLFGVKTFDAIYLALRQGDRVGFVMAEAIRAKNVHNCVINSNEYYSDIRPFKDEEVINAVNAGRRELAGLMLSRGGTWNAALATALTTRRYELAKFLLENGAPMMLEDAEHAQELLNIIVSADDKIDLEMKITFATNIVLKALDSNGSALKFVFSEETLKTLINAILTGQSAIATFILSQHKKEDISIDAAVVKVDRLEGIKTDAKGNQSFSVFSFFSTALGRAIDRKNFDLAKDLVENHGADLNSSYVSVEDRKAYNTYWANKEAEKNNNTPVANIASASAVNIKDKLLESVKEEINEQTKETLRLRLKNNTFLFARDAGPALQEAIKSEKYAFAEEIVKARNGSHATFNMEFSDETVANVIRLGYRELGAWMALPEATWNTVRKAAILHGNRSLINLFGILEAPLAGYTSAEAKLMLKKLVMLKDISTVDKILNNSQEKFCFSVATAKTFLAAVETDQPEIASLILQKHINNAEADTFISLDEERDDMGRTALGLAIDRGMYTLALSLIKDHSAKFEGCGAQSPQRILLLYFIAKQAGTEIPAIWDAHGTSFTARMQAQLISAAQSHGNEGLVNFIKQQTPIQPAPIQPVIAQTIANDDDYVLVDKKVVGKKEATTADSAAMTNNNNAVADTSSAVKEGNTMLSALKNVLRKGNASSSTAPQQVSEVEMRDMNADDDADVSSVVSGNSRQLKSFTTNSN